MFCILYKLNDKIAVLFPTNELELTEVIAKDIPSVPYAFFESDKLPPFMFQEAWIVDFDNPVSVEINMSKARDIHRNFLRQARVPYLEQTDIEFRRAIEKGEPLTSVVAKAEMLRNLPADPAIDAAQTINELIACWPDWLNDNPYKEVY